MDTKKLRQKILDLAIRGKLVPQDPNDEPASVLLERIRAEKERLIKEGKIKRSKKSASDTPHYENEVTFEVPEGWEWCKLEDLVCFQGGYAYKSSSYIDKSNWQIIRIGNVKNDELLLDNQPVYVSEEIGCDTQRYLIKAGDILFTMTGTKGKRDYFFSVVVPNVNHNLLLNQRVGCLRSLSEELNIDFLCLILKGQYVLDEIFATETGNVSQGNIGSESTLNLRIAVPPVAEQQRIIAVVKRWFSIIDVLEKETSDLSDSIQLAKTQILNLAIHGKLVPQDPNDEPAIELLKRINPKFTPCDNAHYPYDIPKNWEWTNLGEITNYGNCENVDVNDIPKEGWVLELEDLEKDSAKIIQRLSKDERDIKGVRHTFHKGDVLYSKLRTYLNKVMVAPEDGFCTTEIIPVTCMSFIQPEYLNHVLRSKYFVYYTIQCGYGVKMPRLSTSDARNGQIPLPPYKEQLRIVAKIQELFSVLDKIEESIKD